MKQSRSALALLSYLVLAAAPLASASGYDDALASRIPLFLGAKLRAGDQVAVLNHRTAAWSLFRCPTTARCVRQENPAVDPKGGLRINVAGRPQHVIVADTNVLIFGIGERKATDADLPGLASLQVALAALTGGISSFGSLAQILPAGGPGAPAQALGPGHVKATPTSTPGPGPAGDELVSYMATWGNAHIGTLQAVKAAAQKLSSAADSVEVDQDRLVSAIQLLENQGSEFRQLFPPRVADVKADHVDSVRVAILEVEEALDKLDKPEGLHCVGRLSNLEAFLRIVAGAPYAPAALPTARNDRDVRLAAAIGVGTPPGCSAEASDRINELANQVATQDLALAWPATSDWIAFRIALLQYVKLAESSDALMTKLQDAMPKAAALTSGAALVDQTVSLISAAVRGGDVFVDMLLVEELWSAQAWTQVRTVAFKVDASAPLQDKVKKTRMALEGTYSIERSRVAFEVGFGLQFSAGAAVYDYTWDAVADPRDSTKKVIGATQRSKRNAIPAVVLTLMPAGSPDSEWRPGLDFGVSLNKDRVFLSLGGSIQVASFLRVGASWVHHRVKQLQSPQKAMEFNADGSFIKDSLTPVTTSADIRMIDGKDDGLQFTVAITLDKLNPFK